MNDRGFTARTALRAPGLGPRLGAGMAVAIAVVLCAAAGSGTEPVEGHLEVDGASLYYKARGRGEPIVVLHGGPGFDHRQFLPFIWELAENHRVVLYDQRGTGLSSGRIDAESINLDTFVDDIEGVREALGIERLNLLAHSWGGVLAMHYAVRHPEKLRSLILCSTTASRAGLTEMREVYSRARPAEDTRLLREIQASPAFQSSDPQAIERFWRVFLRVYFVDPSLASKLDLTFTENTIANGGAVARYLIRSAGDFDLHDELRSVESPTLVLHGDSDPLPVKYARRIRDSIPGAELVIAEGSGHWPFVDATATFRDSILEFLSRLE